MKEAFHTLVVFEQEKDVGYLIFLEVKIYIM